MEAAVHAGDGEPELVPRCFRQEFQRWEAHGGAVEQVLDVLAVADDLVNSDFHGGQLGRREGQGGPIDNGRNLGC